MRPVLLFLPTRIFTLAPGCFACSSLSSRVLFLSCFRSSRSLGLQVQTHLELYIYYVRDRKRKQADEEAKLVWCFFFTRR